MRFPHSSRIEQSLAISVALLLLWGAGCSHPGRASDPTRRQGNELRIAIAPTNLAVRLPAEFSEAVEPVEAALIEHFRARGSEVAVVHRAEAWSLWRHVITSLRATEGEDLEIGTALGAYARALTEHDHFDLLVLPSLVFREAETDERHARWDGVQRRIHLIEGSAAKGSERFDSEWQSRVTALSLHVAVFTRAGEQVFEGFGGLDAVHDVVLSRGNVADRPSLRLRRKLLDNPEFVDEGVAVAFARFRIPDLPARDTQHIATGGSADEGAAAPAATSPPAAGRSRD